MTVVADAQYLIQRLRTLGPGERMVYFVGFLDEARMTRPPPREVIAANIAYALYEQGLVTLTQRRLSQPVASRGGFIDWKLGVGSGFEYIAIGRPSKKEES